MDDDAIAEGLAAHGVALFADPREGAVPPDPAGLIEACLRSPRSRFRLAVIPLLLRLEDREARAAIERLRGSEIPWLRRVVLAADYLAHAYRSELAFLLGREPRVPADLVDGGALPPPTVAHGEWGLRALADEIADDEGAEIDWHGSLEGAVRQWIDFQWHERAVKRARAG